MTIDEIVIQNFGIYQHLDPINLRTTKNHPIILFGGLNGGGKTTILDAILLCLYGPLAKTSNRGSKNYHDYLRESLNRHTNENEVFIELTFRHHRDGNMDEFRIRRKWKVGKTVQESLSVHVNGNKEELLCDNWLNFIDELIPSQVANLFFFDGEKIEQFADLENAQQLLESALHSLLGLDILNQLNIDLKTFEQRKNLSLRTTEEQQELKAKQHTLDEMEEIIKKTKHHLSGAKNDLVRVKANLKSEKLKYSRKGGDLYEQREQLLEAKLDLEHDLQEAKGLFRNIASAEAPLIIINQLLDEVVKQADKEDTAKQAGMVVTMLSERDKKTLETVEQLAGKDVKTVLYKQLQNDRERHEKIANVEQYLDLSDSGLRLVHKVQNILPSIKSQFYGITNRMKILEENIEHTDKKIQSIPDTETVKLLRAGCERWETEEHKLNARISLLEEEFSVQRTKADNLQHSIFNSIESNLNEKFMREDDQRAIAYSKKARVTLETLKIRVINNRLNEIEDLILSSFKQLIRKTRLIGKICISAEDYSLTLFNDSNQEIHPSRLSAGERQLLAVSILWGLAKAAGTPLPVVIDTPLGRLDGNHRNKLLKHYFPNASHQVLIFSTDTEIAEHYYSNLKPFIKRSYQIEYNPSNEASEIKEGYQFA